MEKITYASLGSLGEEFHTQFEAALKRTEATYGALRPLFIGGKPRRARNQPFADLSPADTRVVLARFQTGDRDDTQKAIDAAKAAFPEWRALGSRRRIELLRKAAAIMTERQFDTAALLVREVGKNRFEAIAEVSEAIDLISYYCDQFEEHEGFELTMVRGGAETTRSLLKPYGVWAVIAPFNFPFALSTGMVTGALVGGNTVVFKPASDTPGAGLAVYEAFRDAGLPDGVCNFVTGPGSAVGEELVDNPEVDGLVFTGSRTVGLQILTRFGRRIPRPCIVEMGGKNPALVMPSANLEDAAEGVVRSAFGMSGEKCSACSRLYLHKAIYDAFLRMLVEKTAALKVGDPADRDVFVGPLINRMAIKKYEKAVRLGLNEGRVICGGNTLTREPFRHGFFVEPAIIERAPKESLLFQEEFFAPVLAVREVGSLDEAIQLANACQYGLTAGIFTQDESEKAKFFNQIEAGVTYCNRRGGATTGAWPGVQSFGGWKSSGSTGKNALGPYYVQQFLREQSQTTIGKR